VVRRDRRGHQLASQLDLTRPQRGDGHDLEATLVAPATLFVGRDGAHLVHVGQGFTGAAEFGQRDHAVDQQGRQQPGVGQPPATLQALVDLHQRGLGIAQLHQLVAQVAVQRHFETRRPGGRRVAQRRVHVGEGLVGLARHRVAAGNGIEQHASLLMAQQLQAFVAQLHQAAVGLRQPTLAPPGPGDPGLGQDGAGAVARLLAGLARLLQLADGVCRRGQVQRIEAQHQLRPGTAELIAARQCACTFCERDRPCAVGLKQFPRALRQAQRRLTGEQPQREPCRHYRSRPRPVVTAGCRRGCRPSAAPLRMRCRP
jgi:hypothetical protein